jgi:hypothetical protein
MLKISRVIAGVGIVALIAAGLMGPSGCKAPEMQTHMSPPLAVITGNPWQEATLVSKRVPRSIVLIGHGKSMEPLYPEGTVLVLQRLNWDNLRAGMTAVYNKDPDNPYHMVAHLLLKKDLGEWRTQGFNNAKPDETWVTEKNYIGTVVAAFRKEKTLDAVGIIQKLPSYESGTCLLRCHVEALPNGHARVTVPGAKS